ncbi:hypothetical protein DP20_3632 [Shigella flexneri]|nr:hypothetical protein DP20_3632 [Shigella flexneri]
MLRQSAIQFPDSTGLRINRYAIGVKPGVYFHPTLVGFVEHELQRIVTRIFTNLTGHKIGPRQNFRWPQGGTVRLDLEKDRVYAETLEMIQFVDHRLLLYTGSAGGITNVNRGNRWPVEARNRGQPDATHRL